MANAPLLRILAGVSLALALGACDGDKTKSPADGADKKVAKDKGDKAGGDKAAGDKAGGGAVAAADGGKSAGDAAGGGKTGADGGEKVKVVDAGGDERFDLMIEGPADAKAGAEGQALVRVVPKGPWHMNLDYPTKLVLSPGDGVKVASGELKKQDAKTLTEEECAYEFGVTPDAAGDHTVAAEFRFAVCKDEACVPVTKNIEIKVAAK